VFKKSFMKRYIKLNIILNMSKVVSLQSASFKKHKRVLVHFYEFSKNNMFLKVKKLARRSDPKVR